MLTDSHCHLDRLDLARFGGSLAGVLDAAASGTDVLLVGLTAPTTSGTCRASDSGKGCLTS